MIKKLYKISIFILVVLIINCSNIAYAEDQIDLKKIDQYINTQFESANIPGLVVSIVKDNKIVYMKGFGYADLSGRKMTSKTPLIIGSTSKSFTALAIMQLVDKKKIELDAPVQKYIPWFRVYDKNMSTQITVRNLLNHTSGLSKFGTLKYISNSDLGDLESYVRELRKVKLEKPVGTTYQYSNENYQILGLIIQEVSGLTYEEYIKKNIFNPLEMKNSFTSKTEALKYGLASGYQLFYGLTVKANLTYPKAYLPCGYIISSVDDMSKYMIMQINNGKFNGNSVISSIGIKEMHKPAVAMSTKENDNFYGMGWIVGNTCGIPTIKHDGAIENYRSDIAIIPDGNWGIITMSNINNVFATSDPVSDITTGIICLIKDKYPPEKISKYSKSYIKIDFIFLITIILSSVPLCLILNRYKQLIINQEKMAKNLSMSLIIYFILPSVVILEFGNFTGFTWLYIYRYASDFGYIIILCCILLFITGVIKLAMLYFKRANKEKNINN